MFTMDMTKLRRPLALTLASVALTGTILGGSATAALAEVDPNNGPAQTLPIDDSNGTSGNWNTPGSGTPWVADQFYYVDHNLAGFDFYQRYDGEEASAYDAWAMERNYNYGTCLTPWWTDQLMCHN